MIIVNQDKGVIINMNNIACIQVSNEYIGNIEVILFNKIDNHNGLTIGKYETEERAKEVLQEIINLYATFELEDGGIAYKVINLPKIYKMPEE